MDTASEPSMEEILAQIRKIIADEPLTSRAEPGRASDRRQIDRRSPLLPTTARSDSSSVLGAPLPRTNSYPSVRTEVDTSGARSAFKPEPAKVSANVPLPAAPFIAKLTTGPKPLPAPSAETHSPDDDLSDLVEPVATPLAEAEVAVSAPTADATSLVSRVGALSADAAGDAPIVPALSSLLPRTAAKDGPGGDAAAPVEATAEAATTAPVSLAERLAAAAAVQAEMPVASILDAPLSEAPVAMAVLPEFAPAKDAEPVDQPVVAKVELAIEATSPETSAPAAVSATDAIVVSVAEDPMETALGALAAGLAASRLAAPAAPVASEAITPVAASTETEEPAVKAIVELAAPEVETPVGAQAEPPPDGAPADTSSDDAMAELLRPMLRQWLDTNMPRIVERALRVELAKNLKPPK